MKKFSLAIAASLALALQYIGVANAVTDGTPDGNGHPHVGLLVFDVDGDPAWRCSGTLLSPRILLTAGHCTDGATGGRVWFESDVQSQRKTLGYPSGGRTSVEFCHIHTHPRFSEGSFVLHDVGVVELCKPVKSSVYGALPAVDQLDTLAASTNKKSVWFTAVGYGLQKSFPDAASWKDQAYLVRMVANPELVQINVPGFTGDFSLLLSNNTATGGTCFGDSGGPNFIGSSNVVGGVTSYGKNGTCGGQGGVYRVDKADDLDWLATFGVRP